MKLNNKIFGLLIFILLVTFVSNVTIYAKTNLEWKETNTVYGDCDLNDKDQPIQYKTVTYTCSSKNGKDDNCTLGQIKVEQEIEKSCNISKAYCHANSGASGYTYHNNTAWIQHIRNNGTPQSGHELDFLTWVGNTGCLKASPSPSASPSASATPTATPTSTPTATPTSTPTATPTQAPSQTPSSTPTATPTSTPTATPTNVPSNDPTSTPGTSNESGIGGGQVLGTTTLAATGAVENALFNSIFTLGSLLVSFGIMKNGRKKVQK